MSKAGKKMIAGAKEAVAISKGNLEAIRNCKVTPSCGCVFCDLKIDIILVDGKPHHKASDGYNSVIVTCGLND